MKLPRLYPYEWLLLVLLILAMGALLAALHEALRPRETLTLRADEWECTADHTERRLMTTIVGKVTVMTPTTSTVCDEYRRRP